MRAITVTVSLVGEETLHRTVRTMCDVRAQMGLLPRSAIDGGRSPTSFEAPLQRAGSAARKTRDARTRASETLQRRLSVESPGRCPHASHSRIPGRRSRTQHRAWRCGTSRTAADRPHWLCPKVRILRPLLHCCAEQRYSGSRRLRRHGMRRRAARLRPGHTAASRPAERSDLKPRSATPGTRTSCRGRRRSGQTKTVGGAS